MARLVALALRPFALRQEGSTASAGTSRRRDGLFRDPDGGVNGIGSTRSCVREGQLSVPDAAAPLGLRICQRVSCLPNPSDQMEAQFLGSPVASVHLERHSVGRSGNLAEGPRSGGFFDGPRPPSAWKARKISQWPAAAPWSSE